MGRIPMTEKKEFRKRRGPRVSNDDRIRVSLAEDYIEKFPGTGAYDALRHACVIHSKGLPNSLSTKLQLLPREFNKSLPGLTDLDMSMLNDCVNQLNKHLHNMKRTWDIDTSSIPGSALYDPEIVADNEKDNDFEE